MKNKYIEFKKKRELDVILSDSFAFLKSQFKPLLTVFFKIVGPYILLLLLSLSIGFYTVDSIFDLNSESLNDTYFILLAVFLVSVLIISSMAIGVLSQSSILYFIASYIDNNGTTNFAAIKKKVYQNFWPFLGLGFLVALSIGIGMIFCFIPGIYLYVPLSLSFAIYVFSKKDVMNSYNYSFTLIKGEWWLTFATLFVISMIIGIIGFVFSIPAFIYDIIKTGISYSEYDVESSPLDKFSDPIYIVLNLVSILFRFVINIIAIIAAVLIYFNLNERKNLTGTYERIKNLGQNPEN